MTYFLYHDTPEKKQFEAVLGEPTGECRGGDVYCVWGKDSQKKARKWERDLKLRLELDLDRHPSGTHGTIKRNETVIGWYHVD